jgi:hypothetical protein
VRYLRLRRIDKRKEVPMSKRMLPALLALTLLVLVAGCSVRHGDFTVITNRNVGEFDMTKAEKVGSIEGISKKPIIIIFPTGTPHLEDAVDDALMKSDADYLTDAVVHYSWFYIPYIYGEYKWKVEGTAWKIKK